MKTLINSYTLPFILLSFVLMSGSVKSQTNSPESFLQNDTWLDYRELQLKSVSEVKSLSDSVHQSTFDTVAEVFKLAQRTFHAYDSGGLLIQRTRLSTDKNGNWKNYSNDTLVYIGLQLRKVVNQQWDAQLLSWKNSLKFDYYYDSTNVLTSIQMSSWNSTELRWELSEKQQYSYNQAGLLIEDLYQVWKENLSLWENRGRTTFTYNASQLSSELFEQWNSVSLNWQSYTRSTYTYSSGNLAQTLHESYSQSLSAWENDSRNTFTYNQAGKQETDTEDIWSAGSWKNSVMETYTYMDNNLKSTLQKRWNLLLSTWRNYSMIENYYSDHDVFGIAEEYSNNLLVRNPLNRGAEVRLNLEAGQFPLEISLIALNGQKVMSRNAGYQESVLIPSEIPAGIYILRCRMKNGIVKVQKLLITE